MSMIYLNRVTLAGEVTKIVRLDDRKLARIWLNCPAGDADNEKTAEKTVTHQVDVVGDRYAQTELIKPGDFFACKAQIVALKLVPDSDKDKKWSVKWLQALPSRNLVIIPDGGKYAKAAFNEIEFTGKVFKVGEVKTVGKNNTKMCRVTLQYMPKLDRNASEDERKAALVYVDVAFFGGTAENYIAKYCKEGDCMSVEGHLDIYKENWTSKGKDVVGVQINARDAKFITPQAKDGGGRSRSDAPDTSAYSGDDLPI